MDTIGPDALPAWLPPRPRDSHKGANGHVLCIGGDHGSGGAIVLCAQAALHAGAGLASVATRAAHVPALLARQPEAMAHAIESADALAPLFARATVIAIGPGLGQDAWGRAMLGAALAEAKPLVLDADALNLLAAAPRALPAGTILTPHPGEAARLLGTDVAAVQSDRNAAALALVQRHGVVVVLKGAGTLVAAPGRAPRIVAAGNPGMATGGMGDLLTGVVAALRAQGLDAFDAASCGALLHAHAGDLAAREGGMRGLLPSDLLPWLRRCANPRDARA
jgi:NAD(P)H-hydrate epimerase